MAMSSASVWAKGRTMSRNASKNESPSSVFSELFADDLGFDFHRHRRRASDYTRELGVIVSFFL
jgi:hypothetical protein